MTLQSGSTRRSVRSFSIRKQVDADLLERLLLTTFTNATAAAALNAAHAIGRGNRHFADQLAVNAMREVLNRELIVAARIVIGEGERDKAPMLYIGEMLGPSGELLVRIAVDPLEGTNLAATGSPYAIAILAAAVIGEGFLMDGIDGYMDKIVVGADIRATLDQLPELGLSLDFDPKGQTGLLTSSPEEVVYLISRVRNKPIENVRVVVLDRPRNEKLIERLRVLSVQLVLISDGDVTAAQMALDPEHEADAAWGIGAAPEGVITAAMTQVFGGYMEAKVWVDPNDPNREVILAQWNSKLAPQGLSHDRLLRTGDMANGHVMFSLTPITDGLLKGIKYIEGKTATSVTVYGRSRTGTVNTRYSIHPNPPPPPQNWPVVDGEE